MTIEDDLLAWAQRLMAMDFEVTIHTALRYLALTITGSLDSKTHRASGDGTIYLDPEKQDDLCLGRAEVYLLRTDTRPA